jgi:imidazoleglycerol phosphate synthase glutamine amidotransferase subunit HisH
MNKICIIDYGLGNIKNLFNSLKKVGFDPEFFNMIFLIK